MVRSGRRTGRQLAYDFPPDFRAANRSTTSRLPIPRKAAIAARFLPLGRALPCSQAYTLCPDAPTSSPKSAAERPRRLRLLAMPEARNRKLSAPSPSSTAGGDGSRAGAARADCRTDRSSSLTLRFNAALSARAAASAFLIESTSPRNSLRARRTISALSTDAMLGIQGLCQGPEEDRGSSLYGWKPSGPVSQFKATAFRRSSQRGRCPWTTHSCLWGR